MPYQYIIFDLDDTLLDFTKGAYQTLMKLFKDYGISDTQEALERYQVINHNVWQRIEQGEARAPLLAERFSQLFNSYHITVSGKELDEAFQTSVAQNYLKIPGAEETLKQLKEAGVTLLVGSNGVADIQYQRLEQSGLMPYFSDIFISDHIGAPKPKPEFFNYIFNKYPDMKHQTLMIGDRLEADILGAYQSHLDSIWYNPNKQTNYLTIQPTYQVYHLEEIPELIKKA